jgi:hypothetical protein
MATGTSPICLAVVEQEPPPGFVTIRILEQLDFGHSVVKEMIKN